MDGLGWTYRISPSRLALVKEGKKEGGKKKRAVWVRGDRFSLKPNPMPAPPQGICKVGRPAAGPSTTREGGASLANNAMV